MSQTKAELVNGLNINAAAADALTINSDGDVTFTGASYNVIWDKSSNALEFKDNAKASFGDADGDLEIYHNGSDSYIKDGGTGNLFIATGGLRVRNAADSANLIKADEGGAARLYYDDDEKLRTASYGLRADHNLYVTENILIDNDTGIIKLGTGADLQIFHDGSNSYLQHAGGGGLIIKTNGGVDEDITIQAKDAIFLKPNDGDAGVYLAAEGAVELYYNNGKRVETTNYGLKVTGNSNDPASANWDTNSSIVTGGTYGGGIAMVDGSAGFVQYCHGFGANWELKSGATDATPATNIKATHGGAVSLYHNNSPKLNTSSLGVDITGRVTPTVDDTNDLGYTNLRWDDIYATNSSIQTSDRNEKEDITATDLGLEFVNKLTPVSFKRKGKTRTHYGLVAQDLETVITDLGKTTTQFAPLIKNTLEDGTERYGLRYGELISPLIKAIQELSAKVTALEAK